MLKLNSDLGESYGSWMMGRDADVMPHIHQANIACGFHAGDPQVLLQTLALARQHEVMVGAHPGYPDLVGFGRRSIQCSGAEIKALVMYQTSAMDGLAKSSGLEMAYVKPHGALYNDMMASESVRLPIMEAIRDYHRPVHLMLQATGDREQHLQEARAYGIDLWFEAFADRCYDDNGRLLSRNLPGAVLSHDDMIAQVKQICDNGTVTSVSGKKLTLEPDTLCVHGDNEAGINAIREIRAIVDA